MASTEASTTAPERAVPPPVSSPPPPVTANKAAPPATTATRDCFKVCDVALRAVLFSTAVTAVLVMVTSKQTKTFPMPIPPFFLSRPAKFQHSPAFIYFVAALSVAGLYSIISGVLSFLTLLKPTNSSVKIMAHFLIIDVLMLGIVASATGASGAVAYIGLNGNSHVNWGKICNMYGRFCVHAGASVLISFFSSIVLALLVILSAYSLSKKIPK